LHHCSNASYMIIYKFACMGCVCVCVQAKLCGVLSKSYLQFKKLTSSLRSAYFRDFQVCEKCHKLPLLLLLRVVQILDTHLVLFFINRIDYSVV